MTVRNLEYILRPDSVAIVGTGGPCDTLLARNLVHAGFKGPVMPVVRGQRALEGLLAYESVEKLPLVPDLALVTHPLNEVPELIDRLGRFGVRAAVVLSPNCEAGFNQPTREAGQAILEAAKPHLLRVVGPNSMGLIVPGAGLNATLSQANPKDGHVAFITRSGAIARAAMDWASTLGVGISHLICLGSAVDVDYGDSLDYLAADYRTRSIILHLEHVTDPRKFMSAARRAARVKPVIVFKPVSYTESDADDPVYDAAFRRAGLVRVAQRDELFAIVEALEANLPVRGERLAILTNSHSIGVVAADILSRYGGELALLEPELQEALSKQIGRSQPPEALVDLGDNADAERYGRAMDLMMRSTRADGLLVINSPPGLGDPEPIARLLVERRKQAAITLIASFAGPTAGSAARRLTARHRIPTFDSSDDAVRAFVRIAEYHRNQELLTETPPSVPEQFTPDRDKAQRIIAATLARGHKELNEFETMQVLEAYTIPVVRTHMAETPERAAELASELGGKVALKIITPDILHKSTVRGVALELDSPDAVLDEARAMIERLRSVVREPVVEGFVVQPMVRRPGAYELTMGVQEGANFGPIIYFGHGGTEAQTIGDMAYGLPPLNMALARELMSRTRIFSLLRSSMLRTADVDSLALSLLKISQMIIDLPEIAAMEINPVWADSRGAVVLDAHVWVGQHAPEAPRRLAIKPYPKELEEELNLPDGRVIQLRPMRPEDEPALQELVRRADPEDLRLRFFQPIKELSHHMAARLTQLDYDREMALAVADPGPAGEAILWGGVRITADANNERAEYAIMLDRAVTGLGLGPLLMRRIIDYARERGLKEIYGEVLRENEPMLKLNRALGFKIQVQPDDPGIFKVSLSL